MKNLISCETLEKEDIRRILSLATHYHEHVKSGRTLDIRRGHFIVNLFFEPSTRTVTSFDIATKRLGADSIQFSPSTSSTVKGETLLDTAKNIQAMNPSLLIIRHSSSGIPEFLGRTLQIPLINAGDGFHEHPTQALLDLFTITQFKKKLDQIRVLIVGDIAHSRVARSNVHLLKKMGVQVTLCGPPTLLPPDPEQFGVEVTSDLTKALPRADVVMMLRIQFERQNKMQIPSPGEYARFWGLHARTAKFLKNDAIIMHPGPLQRGVEISPEIADGPNSVILNQVGNGIAVRMAAITLLTPGPMPSDWKFH